SVAFSHDSTLVASTYDDGTVCIWNTDNTKQRIQTCNGYIGFMSSVAFSHDLTCLASASRSGAIGIWDVMEQDQKLPLIDSATVDKHVSPVDKITFSHDASLVASTSLNDNTLMVWSATTGHCIQSLKCPGDVIENVSFSHDCSLVASVCHGSVPMEGQACIWKIDTGVCISHFPTSTEYQALRTFSHDLEFLATSTGETVDLWHVRRGISASAPLKKIWRST
ncbi:uncharacterized protein TRIVIDRAFT_28901, partial [Trichoderma virens Gv29-8]